MYSGNEEEVDNAVTEAETEEEVDEDDEDEGGVYEALRNLASET